MIEGGALGRALATNGNEPSIDESQEGRSGGRISRQRWRVPYVIAGGVAAAIWAAQQPLDQRAFRYDYNDTELLGKAVTQGRAWPIAGIISHVGNGAVFGLAFSELRRRTPNRVGTMTLAQAFAQAENFGLFPLSILVDRYHPARHEIPRLWFVPRALAQATWRHGLFGILLGLFTRRLSAPPR